VSRRRAALAVLALALAAARAWPADNPAEVMELGRIDVVGTTPLPGLGTPLANVPANVQVFGARALDRQRTSSLPDFLERGAAGTAINSAQGNPFQPDVLYRGFVASPLLGLPQGLAVFQDGVRINEPFGDVVNWDLLPRAAIASVQLIPGSNAAFGPNALGGALAVYTKSGSQFPGGALQGYGGSFGRGAVEVEHGGAQGAWDWFVAANALRDQGWAAHNPSRLGQLFAKVGRQTDASDIDVSLTAADNTLSGAQALPRSFGDDIRQPYTWPDRNTNRMRMLAAKGSVFLSPSWLLGATAHARRYRNASVASNVNADFGDPAAGTALSGAEATNDRSALDQSSGGAGLQLTHAARFDGRENRFVAGASADIGTARFTRSIQPARFTADRAAEGIADFTPDTDAASRTRHYGVFVSDTFEPGPHWALTVSARRNVARIGIEDRSGLAPALDGAHRYARVSPAIGVNFKPAPGLTAYAAYTESVRMPTAVELTCADPADPCRLPNAFLTDPDLAPVVARTREMGARGRWGEGASWSLAFYRTELDNDIQFVASAGGSGNAGYFRNVGRTRREGVEAAAATRWGRFGIEARAAWVAATFRSPFAESSPANSSADAAGAIAVAPGDRIPGVPQRSLRLRLDYEAPGAGSAGAMLLANGPIHARGDENDRDAHGPVAGYAVLNLDARWRLAASTELFLRVDNALDARYANFAVLGENAFAGPARTFDPAHPLAEPFYGYGVPRGVWAGVRHEWR
jgi:iron complex outermembrane receptor protein